MELLLNYIFRLLFIIAGAGSISVAITCYNEGSYFATGLMVMMAIYSAIYLAKASMET